MKVLITDDNGTILRGWDDATQEDIGSIEKAIREELPEAPEEGVTYCKQCGLDPVSVGSDLCFGCES